MTAPTFVAQYDSPWYNSTSPKVINNVVVQTGDLVLVYMANADSGGNFATPTSPDLTFSPVITQNGGASQCDVHVYSATASSNATTSISENMGGNTLEWGMEVHVWRNSDGVGATAGQSGYVYDPSIDLTTQYNDSAITWMSSDWNALDDGPRTPFLVNGSSSTENIFAHVNEIATGYINTYANAGTAGTKTVGLTTNATQKLLTTVAVEIRGTVGAPPPITYGNFGDFAYSSNNGTSVSPAYPAGISSGDLLLLIVSQKPTNGNADAGTVTTPTGWELVGESGWGGGYGTTISADNGNTNVYVYKKVADGTETGTLTVDVALNNICSASIQNLSKTSGEWSVVYAAGTQDTTPTSTLSVTSGNISVATDDYVFAIFSTPTDVTAPAQYSAETLTQTGTTFDSVIEVGEWSTSTGTDMGGVIAYAPVTSGSGTGGVTFGATLAGTLTNVRGPLMIVRVRASAPQLIVSDATHSHTADNVALVPQLLVADATHSQTADSPALVQHNVLVVQDATHVHTVQNVGLGANFDLAVAGAAHGHTADNVALTQHNVLSVNDSTHSQTADNLTLSLGVTELHLFDVTPQLAVEADPSAVSLSVEFGVTKTAWVTKLRYLHAASGASTATRYGDLFEVVNATTGIRLTGTHAFPTPVNGQWNEVVLPTPVQLTAGTRYRSIVWHPAGVDNYIASPNYFSSGGTRFTDLLIGGYLILYGGESTPAQGQYEYSSTLEFTTNTFNYTNYWVDVAVTDVNPLGDSLIIQGASHVHTADSPVLTQHNVLAVQDALHIQTADNVVFTVAGVLVVQDAAHVQTASNVLLTQHNVLIVQGAQHAHLADLVTLSGGALQAKVWNGTSWQDTTVQIWNGTSWRSDAQIWNGTSWVNL